MSLSSTNLLWQKRLRGLLPVTANSVTDHGQALLIKPDELENRTYQLLAVDAAGEATEVCALSVETIRKFEVVPGGRLLAGITNDDLYLFRESRKTRFMPDRRVAYSDISLSPETGWFACGFSDAHYSSHAVAFGDANGRLGWTRVQPVPVNRLAIARDGRTLALGQQDGGIQALDHMRNPLWLYAQPEPVTAVAVPATGPACIAGTDGGTLLALDAEGAVRWRCALGLPILDVACDAAADWVAAVAADGETSVLACAGPDGTLVWEYDLGVRPGGVSLSPNGRHLLVSGLDGSVWLFEVDFGAALAGAAVSRRTRRLEAARESAREGDLRGSREALLAVLRSSPEDVEAAEALRDVEQALLARFRQEAADLAALGQFEEAMEVLAAAADTDPWDPDLFHQRLALRRSAETARIGRARELEEQQEWNGAAAAWRQVLELDPVNLDARAALRRCLRAEAEALTSEGDRCFEAGDVLNAVTLWQEAQQLDPGEALQDRLRRAEVARCLAAGIGYYEAGRLPEAAFQFRKVLGLDPENETARRYLGYADGMIGDNLISDRFSRLE